jgi:hypothetical protein
MFVVGDERPLYLIVSEESSGTARVLASYGIRFAQGTKGAQGDVFKVAYGSRDDGERQRKPC